MDEETMGTPTEETASSGTEPLTFDQWLDQNLHKSLREITEYDKIWKIKRR